MAAYTIMISEDQRVALLALLKATSRGLDSETQTNDNEDPLDLWQGMLEDLPKIEAEEPGVIHGFCL